MSIKQQSLFAPVTGAVLPPQSRLDSFVARLLSLAFILDTSGSMAGQKITKLNWAMGELVPLLRKMMNTSLAGSDVRVQVISFSDHATSLYPQPVSPENWTFAPLSTSGGTNLAGAYDEWNQHLASFGNRLSLAPVAILLSDGQPNRPPTDAFARLMQNPRAKAAQRAAVAVGADADRTVLRNFVSSGQKLYEVDSPEGIAEAIVAASMASIEGSIAVGNPVPDVTVGPTPPAPQTMPTIIGGGLSPEDEQALRDAGIDPNDLVS